jgi:tRNA pseudouridine55 synthase
VRIRCSSGTYIRALARDLGVALGVGGHLTALRRTRVGPYHVGQAATVERLAERLELMPLAQAARAAFGHRELSADEAARIAHGGRLPARGVGPAPVAAFAPDGSLVALLTEADGQARSLAVFGAGQPAGSPAGS